MSDSYISTDKEDFDAEDKECIGIYSEEGDNGNMDLKGDIIGMEVIDIHGSSLEENKK